MKKTKGNDPVEAAIKTIEQRYDIGKDIRKTCGPTSPLGRIASRCPRHVVCIAAPSAYTQSSEIRMLTRVVAPVSKAESQAASF